MWGGGKQRFWMAGCSLHPCGTGFEHVSRGPGPTPGMEEEKQLLGSLFGEGAGAAGPVSPGPGRRALESQTGDPGEAHARKCGNLLSCEVSLHVCLWASVELSVTGHCSASASQWPGTPARGACAEELSVLYVN